VCSNANATPPLPYRLRSACRREPIPYLLGNLSEYTAIHPRRQVPGLRGELVAVPRLKRVGGACGDGQSYPSLTSIGPATRRMRSTTSAGWSRQTPTRGLKPFVLAAVASCRPTQ